MSDDVSDEGVEPAAAGPGRGRADGRSGIDSAPEPVPELPLPMMLESLLLVADEPVTEVLLAELAGHPHLRSSPHCSPWPPSTTCRDAASSCARRPEGGASTRGPSARRWSSATCSVDRPLG